MSMPEHAHAVRLTNRARRQKIIDVAKEAFLQNGFDNASMDQIAYAAKMGKMTLYRHFGSKSELFSTAVEQMIGQVGPILKESLDRRLPVEDALYNYARSYLHIHLDDENVNFARLLISKANSNIELSRICSNIYAGDFLSPLEEYIECKIASGELCKENPRFMAEYYMNSIVNTGKVLIVPHLDREMLQSEETLRTIVRLFLGGARA